MHKHYKYGWCSRGDLKPCKTYKGLEDLPQNQFHYVSCINLDHPCSLCPSLLESLRSPFTNIPAFFVHNHKFFVDQASPSPPPCSYSYLISPLPQTCDAPSVAELYSQFSWLNSVFYWQNLISSSSNIIYCFKVTAVPGGNGWSRSLSIRIQAQTRHGNGLGGLPEEES